MHAATRLWSSLSLLAVLLIGGCTTPGEAPQRVEIVDEVDVEATVLSVNKETREIALQDTQGTVVVLIAGPMVRNFDQIEAGDTINASYVISVTARRLAADEPDTEPSFGMTAAGAELGEKPAGGVGAGVTMTVVVKSVDLKSNIVTFTGPDGMLHAVEAQREAGQEFIAGLSPGDRVEMIFVEANVITVN